ncbi:TMM26 protein, partial [Polypterus senegalus]
MRVRGQRLTKGWRERQEPERAGAREEAGSHEERPSEKWVADAQGLEKRRPLKQSIKGARVTRSSLPRKSGKTAGVGFGLGAHLNEEAWVAGIEQSMMLVLVIGRWLMPSAGMTSEQLYQLLLMDSGLGADILDLIDAFKESGVEISRNVRIIGLTVFSWSLMQFPLALTQANDPQDSDSDEDASAYVTDKQSVVSRARKFFKSCMSGEMWSLFIIIGMQDGPSLVFRMYLLIQEKVRSQMMIFFIGKHFISIVFEVYRIVAVIRVINEQEASPLTIDDGQMKLQCINKTLCQAQLSRLMFFIHGVVMVWRVVWVKGDKVYWALAIGVCLLIIESFITLRYTSRGEWKW